VDGASSPKPCAACKFSVVECVYQGPAKSPGYNVLCALSVSSTNLPFPECNFQEVGLEQGDVRVKDEAKLASIMCGVCNFPPDLESVYSWVKSPYTK